ncbi:MAG: hypothetical protein ACD_49C00038G0055 [uncultured bacterium (gcode 4)]|uniref:Uncharacterized protein n=1 Tax=uncultured bacterium (gcode 4) TaxID=1234023 RepID=K2AXL8_9BACT|nr:MAG: hypothetical protein ACD_49C00038G0055 [uncultured bacterium (gcode 4)]
MKTSNIPTSNQKIVGPERLEEKRKIKKLKDENEKRRRAIEAIVRYSDSLNWQKRHN